MTKVFRALAQAIVITCAACSVSSVDVDTGHQSIPDHQKIRALQDEFRNPPDSARALVYWHWADSNISRSGITNDLEWLRDKGLAGVQLFDVSVGSGQTVDEPAVILGERWMDMLGHALSEANRLELEFNIHASPGWSQTGGPWVSPQQAMKKLVWSETLVQGGGQTEITLNAPPRAPGFFQDLNPPFAAGETAEDRVGDPIFEDGFYQDQFVFALPMSEDALALQNTSPKVSFNNETVDEAELQDGKFSTGLKIARIDGTAEIQISFEAPVTIGALTFSTIGDMPNGTLESLAENGEWQELAILPGETHELVRIPVSTFAFAPTKTSKLRVRLNDPRELRPFQAMLSAGEPESYTVSELHWSVGKVHRFEAKAGFEFLYDYLYHPTPRKVGAIPAADVIDLTDALDKGGTLRWDAPPGTWKVLRLGYSLTGRKNQPAVDEGTGLEVDKLSSEHVTAYINGFLGPIKSAIDNGLGPNGINHIAFDSWEAKTSNWTPGIFKEFEQRRGYDPRPFAPALTGNVIGSPEASDQFLWDWRRTIGDLIRENHHGVIQRFAEENGMGVYAQSMGVRMNAMSDGMGMKALANVPMAEFWYEPLDDLDPRFIADVREASSVANLYGKKFAAAEAFTTFPDKAPWGQGPRDLKPVADAYFAEGVNRIVFHCYVHQPLEDAQPGLTLWQFGQFLSRHETWADQARGFFDYLARVSHMLQQGQHVADIGIFLGEGAPISVPFWHDHSSYKPSGYDYNYVDVQTLINGLSVEDGVFVSRGGQRFALLVVPDQIPAVSTKVASRLAELAAQGGVIHGSVLASSPSLAEHLDGQVSSSVEAFQGSEKTVELLLSEQGIAPDFSVRDSQRMKWKHRKTQSADIYFVSNLGDRVWQDQIKFRDKRSFVSLWWPETGSVSSIASQPNALDGPIGLQLMPSESVFVVFTDHPLDGDELASSTDATMSTPIDADWNVMFLDTPDLSMKTEALHGWHTSEDERVKYYSGTARYAATIQVENDLLEGSAPIFLDLGKVGQIAEIQVNDEFVGLDWMPPYRVRVDHVLRPGANTLQIDVTNLWANSMIGDRLNPGEPLRAEVNSFEPYAGNTAFALLSGRSVSEADLLPSGLIGPVSFETTDR